MATFRDIMSDVASRGRLSLRMSSVVGFATEKFNTTRALYKCGIGEVNNSRANTTTEFMKEKLSTLKRP